jgi:hypothetical protein
MTHTENSRPSARQLAYLKALAQRAGQTFAYPRTGQQASAEIARLKAARPSSQTERVIETQQTRAAVQQIGDDAAIRPHEIEGHGSSATWKERA